MVILALSYTTSVFRLVRISMIALFGCSLPRDVGTSAGSGRTAVFSSVESLSTREGCNFKKSTRHTPAQLYGNCFVLNMASRMSNR